MFQVGYTLNYKLENMVNVSGGLYTQLQAENIVNVSGGLYTQLHAENIVNVSGGLYTQLQAENIVNVLKFKLFFSYCSQMACWLSRLEFTNYKLKIW